MDIEVELARATFVIGLVATAFVYERWRMLTGGTITGSYIAYLISIGLYVDVLAWLVLSIVGYLAITAAANYFAIPRQWLFYIGILVPAIVHALTVYVADLNVFSNLTSYLTAGMYVTSGLTAYDLKRQGILKTFRVVAIIVLAALAVVMPLRWILAAPGELVFPETYVQTPPIVMVVAILASALVTTTLGWGSAGIIGAVFLYQILSVESLLVILVITVIGTEIYKFTSRWLLLTPRQQSHAILIVGGISSWFGLFWAQWFGIAGAGTPNEYSLEPLIVIGLMVLEASRIGYRKSFGGTAIVLLLVALTSYLITLGGILPWVAVLALVVAVIAAFGFGVEKINREINTEIVNAKKYTIFTHPNNLKIMGK
jgi:hypothetical protein